MKESKIGNEKVIESIQRMVESMFRMLHKEVGALAGSGDIANDSDFSAYLMLVLLNLLRCTCYIGNTQAECGKSLMRMISLIKLNFEYQMIPEAKAMMAGASQKDTVEEAMKKFMKDALDENPMLMRDSGEWN